MMDRNCLDAPGAAVLESARAATDVAPADSAAREIDATRRGPRRSRTIRFAHQKTEVVVCLDNDPVSIGEVIVAATAPNVDVLTCCIRWNHWGTVVRLVTEDPHKTVRGLEDAGFCCSTASVLLVALQSGAGATARVTRQLMASGIGVGYSYASWTERGGTLAVFHTSDDDRAERLLQGAALMEELGLTTAGHGSRRRTARWPVASKLAA